MFHVRPSPAPSADRPTGDRPAWRILAPGRNCRIVAPASRAAILVDAEEYWRRLDQAFAAAEREILIVGWDFDGRICLRPGPDAVSLGDRLRALVEERPELTVRILVWSVAVLHAPGAPMPLLLGAEWQNHPRIVLRLDTHHPIYAAHHQKIVAVDETLAFAGGMDLTVRRWDTTCHREDDPLRVSPDGTPYSPVHDIQMAVEGDAARAVAQVARERWRTATGEDLAPCGTDRTCWPVDLDCQFRDVPVAVARTAPAWGSQPAVREVARLTEDCLRAARRTIYIEAQYLSAAYVGRILAERLKEPDGPEVVIVLTRASRGVMERLVMGKNRDRLIRRLKRADRHGRLRCYYPVTPGRERPCEVLIHAKLIVVDDDFIRVGSSNLANRSVGLDTELDLAVEATDDATRAVIARIRDGLVAEHLDTDRDRVTAAVAETGSLRGAVDRLNRGSRGLKTFDGIGRRGPVWPILGTALLDPKRPFEPLWFLKRRG